MSNPKKLLALVTSFTFLQTSMSETETAVLSYLFPTHRVCEFLSVEEEKQFI